MDQRTAVGILDQITTTNAAHVTCDDGEELLLPSIASLTPMADLPAPIAALPVEFVSVCE